MLKIFGQIPKPTRLAFTALLCALVISACGGADIEPTPTVGPTSTPEPTPSPVPIAFTQFSFALELEGVYSISTAPVLEPLPNDKSGTLIWARGAVRYTLSWRPLEEVEDKEELDNLRLVSLDRSLNILQASNPNIVVSEVAQPSTETLASFQVTFKTFQIKAGDAVSKGVASTFTCGETKKDFLLGILFADDPKTAISETLSKFKCVKPAS